MRIIDRFDLYMKYKGLNDNKVTTQLVLSNGTIGKSRKPGRDLSARVVEQIEKFYPDLNIEWLRTGTGEMIQEAPAKPQPVDDEPLVLTGAAKVLVMNMSATLSQQEANIARLAAMVDRLTGGAADTKKENAG